MSIALLPSFTRDLWNDWTDLSSQFERSLGVQPTLMSTSDVDKPFRPRVDILKHGNKLVVVADLPGVQKSDISICLRNGSLELSGMRKECPFSESLGKESWSGKGRQQGETGKEMGRKGETLGKEQGETLGKEQGETLGKEQGETLGKEQGETLGQQQGSESVQVQGETGREKGKKQGQKQGETLGKQQGESWKEGETFEGQMGESLKEGEAQKSDFVYYQRERRMGDFFRRIPMPEGINEQDIHAKFENGDLCICVTLPDRHQKQERTIQIQ